ncbi:ABC transporter permease [uncultured Ruminococcus sp.]|uniref:ABC transporter permease n=1 Tax=uncultured Ruminococcus sp. TaxID=165186 RepID=UPI0029314EB6|nr:ABC transporter permease [uncultured Ruminococcus sp.]
MKSIHSLPFVNLIKKPARSIALLILSAFLAVSAFGGSLAVMSLRNGIDSLESRLGADIIVVPYEAATQGSYESVILQGNPGAFYMSNSVLGEVAEEIEGVEKLSAQYFLVSAKAGCCSVKVQIIGFDPATDFSVTPWIERSYGKELSDGDVIVGSLVEVSTGDDIKLFDRKVNVVGQLERTGTELDTAIYCNVNTVKQLMQAAQVKQLVDYNGSDPDKVISSVLVKVRDGYDIDDVTAEINLHVRGIKAIRAKSMISSVSDSLSGVSSAIGVLIAVIWGLSLIIMAISFSMINNERKKEFAVLRVLGASRGMLSSVVFKEAILLAFVGSVCGILLTLLIGALFSDSLTSSIGVPFLLPSVGTMAAIGAATVAATMLAGALTAAISAHKVSKQDTGVILRGDN